MLLWILVLCRVDNGPGVPPAQPAAGLWRARARGTGRDQFRLSAVHTGHLQSLRAPDSRGAGRSTTQPALQDPAFAVHPPILYMGYVGFSVSFALACAAMLEGRRDQTWARWMRPWTVMAWAFLSCGIALGSWWAYYELGWGGFWFWDPVENASFMPWLVATGVDPFACGH